MANMNNNNQQQLPGAPGVVYRRYEHTNALRNHPARRKFAAAMEIAESSLNFSTPGFTARDAKKRFEDRLLVMSELQTKIDAKKFGDDITNFEDLDGFNDVMTIFRDFQLKLPGKFEDQSKQLEDASHKTARLQSTNTDLTTELDKTKSQLRQVESSNKSSSREITRLEKEASDWRSKHDTREGELTTAKAQLSEAVSKLTSEERTRLTEEAANWRTKHAAAEGELKSVKLHLSEVTSRSELTPDERAHLTDEADDWRLKHDTLQSELTTVKSQLAETTSAMTCDERARLTKEASDWRTKHATLEGELKTVNSQLAGANQQLEHLRAENKKLETAAIGWYNKHQALQGQVNSRTEQLTRLQEATTNHTSTLDAKNELISRLEASVTAAEQRLRDQQASATKDQQHREEVNNLGQKVADLSEAQKSAGQTHNLTSNLAAVQEQLLQQISKNQDLQKSLDKTKRESRACIDQLARASLQLVKEARHSDATRTQRVSVAEARLTNLDRSFAGARVDNNRSRSQNNKQVLTIKQANLREKELTDRIASLEFQTRFMDETNARLTKQTTLLRKRVSHLTKKSRNSVFLLQHTRKLCCRRVRRVHSQDNVRRRQILERLVKLCREFGAPRPPTVPKALKVLLAGITSYQALGVAMVRVVRRAALAVRFDLGHQWQNLAGLEAAIGQDVRNITARIKSLEAAKTSLEQDVQARQQTIETLEKDVGTHQQTIITLESENKDLSIGEIALEGEIFDLEQANARLKNVNTRVRDTAFFLRVKKVGLEAANLALRNRETDLEATNAAVELQKSSHEAWNRALADENTELTEAKASLERQVTGFKNGKSTFETQLAGARALNKALTTAKTRLEEEKIHLEGDVKALQAAFNDLERASEELTSNNNIAGSQAELNALREEKQALTTKYSNLETKVTKLEASTERLNHTIVKIRADRTLLSNDASTLLNTHKILEKTCVGQKLLIDIQSRMIGTFDTSPGTIKNKEAFMAVQRELEQHVASMNISDSD